MSTEGQKHTATLIPESRLSQMEAHADEGGTFQAGIVQELIGHIRAMSGKPEQTTDECREAFENEAVKRHRDIGRWKGLGCKNAEYNDGLTQEAWKDFRSGWQARGEHEAAKAAEVQIHNDRVRIGGKWFYAPAHPDKAEVVEQQLIAAFRPAISSVVCDLLECDDRITRIAKACAKAAQSALPPQAEVTQQPDELSALRKFKEHVHKRLDDAGITTHPYEEHSKHGCRIGDRLDIALKRESGAQAVDVEAGAKQMYITFYGEGSEQTWDRMSVKDKSLCIMDATACAHAWGLTPKEGE